MNKEELKPIDVSKYTVTESGNVIKSEEKETTKEDFFRQNFPEYCRGDTFLSPYWDLFEAGYELKQDILSQHILELQNDKGNLTDEVRKLKLLISSLVYEINQIWDINEMDDYLRISAEKIDREVQLSKMAEDNRMVTSALGFAIVPPKPKLDVKEV